MSFAIRQTYTHYQTGEHWTRILPRRWKTRRGAEKAAQAYFRWTTKPDGKTALDNSAAEVIEVNP